MHHTMVPGDRVEHVAVHSRDGERLGMIERLMLDKVSGTVAYAVIKTGGLYGSHHHYPVLWNALRYDPKRQVYETDLTRWMNCAQGRLSLTTRPSTGVIARDPIRIRTIGRSSGWRCFSAPFVSISAALMDTKRMDER